MHGWLLCVSCLGLKSRRCAGITLCSCNYMMLVSAEAAPVRRGCGEGIGCDGADPVEDCRVFLFGRSPCTHSHSGSHTHQESYTVAVLLILRAKRKAVLTVCLACRRASPCLHEPSKVRRAHSDGRDICRTILTMAKSFNQKLGTCKPGEARVSATHLFLFPFLALLPSVSAFSSLPLGRWGFSPTLGGSLPPRVSHLSQTWRKIKTPVLGPLSDTARTVGCPLFGENGIR
ncbi:hypothetical protein B0J13DRAFT_96799 [Dactylonectria estremocensis]|uniref:Secreted protein n=1 Tax=Dactylonectria estremocensis TaxID=1079267 RepID=A0A9P9E9V6_9HYPO|nr:hypothetical protein B0J13DRAFT_96799 [Dactylonectria estremocensis]